MVGIKLLWTGLTIIMASPLLSISAGATVGGIIMVVGGILMWLDK